MHSKFRAMEVALLLVAVAGCSREEQPENVAPVTDEYSGRMVRHVDNAQRLVMTRLGNAPVAGEQAPDGVVYHPESRKPVKLRELWRKKPAVLVFGSGSCPSLNLYEEDLRKLAEKYGEKLSFNLIYIREAHPVGGFQQELDEDYAKIDIPFINDSRSLQDRCGWAIDYRSRREFGMPFFVDDVDDSVAARWSAWPVRVFVVNQKGTVIYAGDQGPWYFKVSKDKAHKEPTEDLEREFKVRPYNRESLEEFFEKFFQPRKST